MPARPRDKTDGDPADALIGVAPLVSRWMERLRARHDPPLRLGQYLALRAIERESLGASELARRTGVSGPAVSQLIAGLVDMYRDNGVDKYYDPTLLDIYGARYRLFVAVLFVLAAIAIVVPLMERFLG